MQGLPHDVADVLHAAAEVLRAEAQALRAEALALTDDRFRPMPARERYRGDWTAVLLRAGRWEGEFPGVDIPANRLACPVAERVLLRLPVSTVAGYLRLAPGATLLPHADEREEDELRLHLALQLPAVEAETWPEGSVRVLDVRVPHAADNASDRARLTFTVDIRLPAAVATGASAWHPV